MENILDITIILPIKSSVVRDFDEYFDKAVTSVKNQKIKIKELLIVTTPEEKLNAHIEAYDFGDLNFRKIVWDKEPSFSAQVNFGVQNANSKWISIFEFDDEYANIWFDNVRKYMEYYPMVQAFLPVVVDTDEKGAFAGFTNEAVFAPLDTLMVLDTTSKGEAPLTSTFTNAAIAPTAEYKLLVKPNEYGLAFKSAVSTILYITPAL